MPSIRRQKKWLSDENLNAFAMPCYCGLKQIDPDVYKLISIKIVHAKMHVRQHRTCGGAVNGGTVKLRSSDKIRAAQGPTDCRLVL